MLETLVGQADECPAANPERLRRSVSEYLRMTATVTPTREQILRFCAEDPIERVFLEDVTRRGLGRFSAVEDDDGRLTALCHAGANVVPSGRGCGAFAEAAAHGGARMLIGEEGAVGELWEAGRARLPEPRSDRPGQPVYVLNAASKG